MKSTGIGLLLLSAVTLLRAEIGPPATPLTERQKQIIAAAARDTTPRFNGAMIVGVRPRTPFLLALSATGTRPITFSTDRLPRGLRFDATNGIIFGTLAVAREYPFKVRAKNSAGTAETELSIVCGDDLALTPPMGWNSYDAFGDSVNEDEVLANAVWLKEHLQPLGWDTVVVDFRWYDAKADGIRNQDPEAVTIDEFGRCIPPTNRFPSAADGAGFKPLADKIHGLGLKFGIHIMRGIPRKAVAANTPIKDAEFTASQAVLPEGDPHRVCVWPNRDMFGV